VSEADKKASSLLSQAASLANGSSEDEIVSIGAPLERDIREMRLELEDELARLDASVRQAIAAMKRDLVRWMFVLSVGEIVVIVCVLFAFSDDGPGDRELFSNGLRHPGRTAD